MNSILDIIFSFVICVIEFYVSYLLLNHFLMLKSSHAACKILAVLICALILTYINTLETPSWNTLVVFSLNFVFSVILFKGKISVKIFLTALVTTISVVSELLTASIGFFIFSELYPQIALNNFDKFQMMTLSKFILYLIVRLINNTFRAKTYKDNNPKSLLLYILPLATICSVFLIAFFDFQITPNYKQEIFVFLVCLGLVCSNFTVFYVYDKSMNEFELEKQLKDSKDQQKAQALYYHQLKQSLENSRKQLHDFKNHISVIEKMHENNKDISEYITSLYSAIDKQIPPEIINIGNPTLNIILYDKKNKCNRLGITFNTKLEYDNLSFIKQIDTCTIFANALDNSITACNNIQSLLIKKYINIYIFKFNSMLVIRIENSKDNMIKEINKVIVSTNHDEGMHGYGLKNIRQVVEQYKGQMSTNYSKYEFILTITFPIQD